MMAQLGGKVVDCLPYDVGSNLPLVIIFAEFIFELTNMVVSLFSAYI